MAPAIYYLSRDLVERARSERCCSRMSGPTRELSSAVSTGDSLQFAESILDDRQCGSILFKRDCYKDLFQLAEEHREAGNAAGVVITGTPGIGKTMFGVQCIHAYAVEKHI